VNTATASCNTITEQMTEMFQRKSKPSVAVLCNVIAWGYVTSHQIQIFFANMLFFIIDEVSLQQSTYLSAQ